jgi:Mg2+/Co2+ transporter CorB
VYEGAPENILGILYVRDYLTALAMVENRTQVNLRDHLRPLYFVPDTTPVGHQLIEFLRLHRHLALVVDEYGDIQGLITLEDILEEIVGDITDEHDGPPSDILETAPDGSLLLRASMPVRNANRQFGWNLPEQSAVTLAGLIVETLGHLPSQGESTTIAGITLQVAAKRGHRLEKIRAVPPK